MFKYLPLLWANLQRKRVRTTLTLASIVIAFLLFGLLQTMRTALTGGAELAGVDRLMTIHKISLIQPLPASYLNRIRSVEGVKIATSQDWFGGIYQDDRNQVAAFAVEPELFFDVYPEYSLPEDQKKAWLSDRGGIMVGRDIAARFGWKVGQKISLRSNIYTNTNGTSAWDFNVSGIFTAGNGDNQSVYFHYEYFNESRSFGKDNIGYVVMRINDPDRASEIAAKVDAQFANSSTETKTSTEKAFIQGFANQLGNIGKLITAVASAVFFTMLLVTANTMGQSIRERINEIGVMKTLGFSSGTVTSLVLGEALLITAIGGVIGLALATVLAGAVAKVAQQFFPTLGMPADAWITGAVLIVVLGLLAALLPCTQAFRLKIVDALRKG
ncbi:MAG TPA: FtsX-like permease family protein [Steroidobacteraceae bacterium]|nr:FtsX-like permease family protein [Steroidobacteraceae bacterium]